MSHAPQVRPVACTEARVEEREGSRVPAVVHGDERRHRKRQ